MKLSTVLTQIVFAAALPVAVMAAPACGSYVSGKVVLDADMYCSGVTGLTITADNTTIDLNGHSIKCTGAGFQGSCQGTQTVGIDSKYKNVLIKGPGKIDGFQTGVYVTYGAGVTVRDLEVTGPASLPLGNNPRPYAMGISVSSTSCPSNTPAINLINNTISNVISGIALYNTKCVKVSHNYLHDLNSDLWGGTGLDLYNTSSMTLDANRIENVGSNKFGYEAGILLQGNSQTAQITNNAVSGNCASGLYVDGGSHDNNVKGNVFRNNGTAAVADRCVAPLAGLFYDIAAKNVLTNLGNTYTKTNLCDTQFGPIPAGVCNPGE